MSEKKKPNPHAGHRNRMRERFLKEGGASFEKHELLELLLYNTIPMQNTNVIAHRLLDSFNNSTISSLALESKLPVGSSAKIMAGFVIIARPIDVLCC